MTFLIAVNSEFNSNQIEQLGKCPGSDTVHRHIGLQARFNTEIHNVH